MFNDSNMTEILLNQLAGFSHPAYEALAHRCQLLVLPLAKHLGADITPVQIAYEKTREYAKKGPWDDDSFHEINMGCRTATAEAVQAACRIAAEYLDPYWAQKISSVISNDIYYLSEHFKHGFHYSDTLPEDFFKISLDEIEEGTVAAAKHHIKLRVFLCHSSSDKTFVRELHSRLCSKNIDPWLDEVKLLPGQDWDYEIQKAVRAADAVVVCLSRSSITKAGYVQKEIRIALDAADMQPENTIFIIPIRLDDCDVPERLRKWQWVNYFEENGYEKLVAALRVRATTLERQMLSR